MSLKLCSCAVRVCACVSVCVHVIASYCVRPCLCVTLSTLKLGVKVGQH